MEAIKDAYANIQKEAVALAGKPGDITQRVVFLHEMYNDSHGRHLFPQVALHGALWAEKYFSAGGSVGKAIAYRYFYNAQEQKSREEMLDGFAEKFKAANRQVFIDTYTNYHFTKEYGHLPAAKELIHPALFTSLQKIHSHHPLTESEKRSAFIDSLTWEQEHSVAPAVARAIDSFDCPVLKRLCLMPIVRFQYFPQLTNIFFWNFADRQERTRNAIKAYDIAEKVGFPSLVDTMRKYNVLPKNFFSDENYTTTLKESLWTSQ